MKISAIVQPRITTYIDIPGGVERHTSFILF